MEEAQVQRLIEAHGWTRVEPDDEVYHTDFITLIKKTGLDLIVLSQCMHCASLVLPIKEIQDTHLLWHKSL